VGEAGSSARFRWVKASTSAKLTQLTHTIAHRLARYLKRQGLLERDAEHSYLTLDNADEDPMDQLRGHSITYRIGTLVWRPKPTSVTNWNGCAVTSPDRPLLNSVCH
jgi:hypothetical protein